MDIKITRNNLTPSLERIQSQLDKLPREAYEKFRDETPRRTGRARSRTRFRDDTIVADYPYARRLDEGHSTQAPDGMTKPTEEFIRRRLRSIMRK